MSMPAHTEDSLQRRLDELLDVAAHTDYRGEMERIRAATFTGRDPANLVTAVVDGDGLLSRIRFGATTSARSPEAVADAILDAVSAARAHRTAAVAQLVARIEAQRLDIEGVMAQMRSIADISTLERQEEVWYRAGV